MKNLLLVLILAVASCKSTKETIASNENQINTVLDSWHKAAAEAQFDSYFNLMADDAIFIGTDATERWEKPAFQAYAKPHFDKGKAWSFTVLDRHVYFDKTKKIAWFDELLNTQMKVCRGSGVLVKINGEWKIKHYVLSMTIPNENSKEVIEIKTPLENQLISDFKKLNK